MRIHILDYPFIQTGVYIIDHERQVIWSKPELFQAGDADVFSHPSITEAIMENKPSTSGLVSAPMTGAPIVLLASPIEMEDGETGALVVAVDLAESSIGGFVQPIKLGQTGYVEIVDQNGIVVARTEPGPKLAPFEKSDHSGRFAALIDAGEPTRGTCHTCHESEGKVEKKDVLAFVPLSEADWGVVIRQSEEEALAPIRELRWNLLLFGLGLVAVALMFVVVTTRDVGSRIRMLTAASQKIAEGDLISPVAATGKDEVGILGSTLNDMRVKLKTSYDELEQKTKELSSLLSVSEILTSTFDLPSIFNAVVTKAIDIIPGADGGVLLLRDAELGKPLVKCAIGLEKKTLSAILIACARDFSPDTIIGAGENKLRDTTREFATLQSKATGILLQNCVSADVLHQNRKIGELVMISRRDNQSFSPSDHRLLQAIADYIAIAIEREQLTSEAEEARALHEADRLRAQFISSVSHELRTPLTLIKGYSTSLLRKNVSWTKETQREFLQTIDEKTDELRDLIDKLLQSAKLEAGALTLEKEPVLIPRLAQKVVEDITLRGKKHKFSLEFEKLFPVLEADIRCMEQVLRNLVENAVKYSPDGGNIVIAGMVKEGKVLVSVSDEGVGIPAEYRDKVFERFYRVDSPSTRNIHGSGLGLSITKGHVEAHGGEVWLESKTGRGSKFCFSLPLEQSDDKD